MKKTMGLFIFVCLFIFSSTSLATSAKKSNTKTLAHHCAVYKKNAQKAKARYNVNKKELDRLEVKLNVLEEDRRQMPSSTRMARMVLSKEMQSLRHEHRKNLDQSKFFLSKHIEYTKAVLRTCAQRSQARGH